MSDDDIDEMLDGEVENNLLNILESLVEFVENRTDDEDQRRLLKSLVEALDDNSDMFSGNWETVLL